MSVRARVEIIWISRVLTNRPLVSERYMSNHMDSNILEELKRFPRGK